MAEHAHPCWGVVAGWGRVLEHEKGFRALCMRPLALSPMFPIDLKLLKDMAATYEIPLLMSVGEVRRAFPSLTTGAPSGCSTRPATSSQPTWQATPAPRPASFRFLNGDGFGAAG